MGGCVKKGKSYRYYVKREQIRWRARLGLCAEGWGHRGIFSGQIKMTHDDDSVLDTINVRLCTRHAKDLIRLMVEKGGEVSFVDNGKTEGFTATGPIR